MAEIDERTALGEAARRELVGAVDALAAGARAADLPAVPDALAEARRTLERNEFALLVLGEMKRGKSTFVNALVGRRLLPTDVDVATAQVFRIRAASEDAARLRLEDGTAVPIGLDELGRYGSQAVIDAGGGAAGGGAASGRGARPSEVIDHIEVDVPVRFLPPGLSLLDTPGLGSLHAAHTQITRRFLPMADAAIFVLDSLEPVKAVEIEILETVLRHTRDVFFVQTKIDLVGRDEWPRMVARNEQILREKLADRQPAPKVWPVASELLIRAGAADREKEREALIHLSRHKELSAALKAFLARVTLWTRSAHVHALAVEFHAAGRRTLSARLGAQTEQSARARAELGARAEARSAAYEADWGEAGGRRRELLGRLRKLVSVGREGFRQALAPGGRIESSFDAQIAGIGSAEQAHRLGGELGAAVGAAAMDAWEAAVSGTLGAALSELRPLAAANPSLDLEAAVDAPRVVELPALRGLSGSQHLTAALREGMPLSLAGPAAALAFGLTGPVALLLGPALALTCGWNRARQRSLDLLRQELRQGAAGALGHVRHHFFDVDPASGRASRVDEYFAALERRLLDIVQQIASSRLAEAKAEVQRLRDDAAAGTAELAARAEQTRARLAVWDETGRTLARIGAQLAQLAGATLAGRPAA